ncbi:hypothetical protein LIER_39862 [Lithospermum erythrorhizon]|uniref:Uncharacterized protein n=1 Tax=Lithospermum erythrorhizon TaxID=34254 RepID=A0AAV3QLA3_LITER
MQCPNCRKIEKGQWLFANGCRSIPEVHFDDWAHDEDPYDMGYSEVPFAVQWHPFSGLAHLPSFEVLIKRKSYTWCKFCPFGWYIGLQKWEVGIDMYNIKVLFDINFPVLACSKFVYSLFLLAFISVQLFANQHLYLLAEKENSRHWHVRRFCYELVKYSSMISINWFFLLLLIFPDHDHGQLAILSEHTSMSSAGHPCPYMAYVGPIRPSPSNTGGSISDGFNFRSNWNGPVMNETSSSYTFPAMDVHYHSWEHHSSTLPMNGLISGFDQTPHSLEMADGPNSEIARPGSYMHPLIVGHRAGSSVVSPMFPPHPRRAARARDHVQALQANFQQPSTSVAVHFPVLAGTRRSNSSRGLSQVGPVRSSPDQNGSFYFFPPGSSGRISQDVENVIQNIWEHEHFSASFAMSQVNRSSGYGSFHQATSRGPNTLMRSSSSRHRNGTERIPPPNWT